MGESTDSTQLSVKSWGYPSTWRTKPETKTKYHNAKFVKIFDTHIHNKIWITLNYKQGLTLVILLEVIFILYCSYIFCVFYNDHVLLLKLGRNKFRQVGTEAVPINLGLYWIDRLSLTPPHSKQKHSGPLKTWTLPYLSYILDYVHMHNIWCAHWYLCCKTLGN